MSESTNTEKFDLDDEDDDFGFIISSEGELKSMMIPEELMDDPPPEIEKILNIFGIKNIHTLDNRTLH
jgi:hypothetical protein